MRLRSSEKSNQTEVVTAECQANSAMQAVPINLSLGWPWTGITCNASCT